MNKVFLLIFVAALIAGFYAFGINNKNISENKIARVCVKDVCYVIEIADDESERARGLMFRQDLGENEGMLFIFDQEEKHSFWMKNTLISLDIVWIDSRGKIVDISQNTPPCAGDPCPSYMPQKPAKYVLEVAAGQMEIIGANKGDEVNIEH